MTIAAESAGTPDFKGFMVTARDANDEIVGTVTSANSEHTVFCWGAVSTPTRYLSFRGISYSYQLGVVITRRWTVATTRVVLLLRGCRTILALLSLASNSPGHLLQTPPVQ